MHCVANVGLRKRLNLYKRGFKIHGKLLKHKYTDSVTEIVSLLWVKQVFVWFYLSVGFEEENKYAKRYYVSHGMR